MTSITVKNSWHSTLKSRLKPLKAIAIAHCLGILRIKDSGIDGLGLFASEDIAAGTYAGETHVKIDENQDWLRTPLGGFINHSEQPNAKINFVTGGVRALTIEKAVKKGEEITVFYVLY